MYIVAESSRPSLLVPPRNAAGRGTIGNNAIVCGSLLALLMVWAVIFPQTGDGDAIMHYLNAGWPVGAGEAAGILGQGRGKNPAVDSGSVWNSPARWASAIISILCAGRRSGLRRI